jgi:hypothetical protein
MSGLPFPLSRPEGLVGRVTGRIGPDTIGEIQVHIRGGVEAFYAHPSDGSEKVDVGEEVLVIKYKPPRTVFVTKWDAGSLE